VDNSSSHANSSFHNNNNNTTTTAAAGSGRTTTGQLDLNLPIPNSRAKAAIVKVYEPLPDIRLTDMLELVGVVSLDPALAHLGAEQQEEDMMMGMGTAPHLPPPSLVPRLHVVSYTKLSHNNPLGKIKSTPVPLPIFERT
jgi:hypothetical protein